MESSYFLERMEAGRDEVHMALQGFAPNEQELILTQVQKDVALVAEQYKLEQQKHPTGFAEEECELV